MMNNTGNNGGNSEMGSKRQKILGEFFEKRVPEGIQGKPWRNNPSVDTVSMWNGGNKLVIEAHPATGRAFDVTPSHEKLPDGVVFAVENTVADAKDRNLPVLSRDVDMECSRNAAKTFYAKKEESKETQYKSGSSCVVEQLSETPSGLVHTGGQGFLAFARHLPLSLGPDEIWAVIAFGFAEHIDEHSEELRHNFVAHKGKKRIEVEVHPSFGFPRDKLGKCASPEDWEKNVFPQFSDQIRRHIGDETHQAIASKFSCTSASAQAVHEIVLMSSMQHYFSYGCEWGCGIPKIKLLGTEEDWVNLRARAETLGDKMMPDFQKWWLPKLLPVLDQFVAAYRGEVHHGFWQSMVKMRHHHANGSGDLPYDLVSGWIQIFFPYDSKKRKQTTMQSWEKCYFQGPNIDEIPAISSSVPVDFTAANGKVFELHFHAGVKGFTQDPNDGTLSPVLGWHLTHDPISASSSELVAEIEALLQGLSRSHTVDDGMACIRIHTLLETLKNQKANEWERMNSIFQEQCRDILEKHRITHLLGRRSNKYW